MSYIFKKGDIVRVKKVVGDDPLDFEKAIEVIKKYIEKIFEKNTLGARIVNTLVHQYFIKGGKLGESDVEKVSFQQMVDEF